MKNKIKKQGHQPLGAALRAPGACCKNKLRLNCIELNKMKQEGPEPLGGALQAHGACCKNKVK
jgi:hypothetical protein